jgi:hypothetical protein
LCLLSLVSFDACAAERARPSTVLPHPDGERAAIGGDRSRSVAIARRSRPLVRAAAGRVCAYFEGHDRGKRSVTLDLHKPEAKEIVLKLVAQIERLHDRGVTARLD